MTLNYYQHSVLQNHDRIFLIAAYRHQASPGFHALHDLQSPIIPTTDVGPIPYHPIPVSSNNSNACCLFYIHTHSSICTSLNL